MSKKIINASGKRKMAIARATIKEGKPWVKINNVSLDIYEPRMAKLRIQEPLLLAGDVVKKLSISVNVYGGGMTSQADAVRLAIAKALADYNESLRQVFLDYDRQLLVADVRRRESRKPNSHGKARAKRQKSYR
ncbi:30S ribosomal protein S9 [Candidatus Woesearchaeota archaeon]|nr:30S ribosomal protein S9 [Candidatus Woesearchaeota archaeon]